MNAEYYEVLAQHLAVIERNHEREMRMLSQIKRNQDQATAPTQRQYMGLRLVHSKNADYA